MSIYRLLVNHGALCGAVKHFLPRIASLEIRRFWMKMAYSCQLNYRGPRIIAVACNCGHLWGEQHRIETRTKRNHWRVNSGRLTISGNYSRSPIATEL